MPPELLERQVPRADATHRLMSISAQAHGIGTLSDLADYFRLKTVDAKPALERLVDEGELLPVTVRGWKKPAYLHRDARIPRRIEAAALLSPFDPVVWERDRALRMFDFHYRIEIYTPAPEAGLRVLHASGARRRRDRRPDRPQERPSTQGAAGAVGLA